MKDAVKIYFKEWLPDLPPLDNPGLLEAFNALPTDSSYRSCPTMTSGSATANVLTGVYFGNSDGGHYVVGVDSAGAQVRVAAISSGAWSYSTTLGSVVGDAYREIVEYDDGLYLMSGQTLSTLSEGAPTVTGITAAPRCASVALINQFAVAAGGSDLSYSVRWSSIADPLDWPTPGSATAIARQSGEQEFFQAYGQAQFVVGGDEFGLVFQSRAVNRMTYVGGNVVFQFDRIAENIGTITEYSGIKVGDTYYFHSTSGFYATNGWALRNISDNKISSYVRAQQGTVAANKPYADPVNNLIYWPFGSFMAVYNYAEDRWSAVVQSHYAITGIGASGTVSAMVSSLTIGSLTGAHGTATFTTGDVEIHPGGISRVDGVSPLVDATVNAITVAIGSRNHLGTAVSYGSATTVNAATGFADMRAEARFHRAKVSVSGTFNAAQGLELRAAVTGKR